MDIANKLTMSHSSITVIIKNEQGEQAVCEVFVSDFNKEALLLAAKKAIEEDLIALILGNTSSGEWSAQ